MNRLVSQRVPKLKLLVLQADTMSYIDASARATMRILVQEWRQQGIKLCLASAIGPVRDALAADGLLDSGDVCFQRNVEGRAVRISGARIRATVASRHGAATRMTKPSGLCNRKHTLV